LTEPSTTKNVLSHVKHSQQLLHQLGWEQGEINGQAGLLLRELTRCCGTLGAPTPVRQHPATLDDVARIRQSRRVIENIS